MRDTIDFSGKQSKNLTVTATPNQQFNFSKSDDDTAILSPNCLAYHRKITASWKFFFLVKLYILLSYEIFCSTHIRGVHISFSLFSHQVTCEDRKWSCSNSSNMRWQDGTVYFFDCWMGGALFKKESWRELDVYCLEGSILPLAHIPMLQKKLTVAKKTIPYFSSTRTLFFYGYQHCYRLKKLELLFVTQAPPFLKFEEWQPPKGIEHSFWRVRELVKKRHHTMMHDFLPLKETRRNISPLSLC